jgi:hypothetical protein
LIFKLFGKFELKSVTFFVSNTWLVSIIGAYYLSACLSHLAHGGSVLTTVKMQENSHKLTKIRNGTSQVAALSKINQIRDKIMGFCTDAVPAYSALSAK